MGVQVEPEYAPLALSLKQSYFTAPGINKNLLKLNGIYRFVAVMGSMMSFQHFLLNL